MEEAERTGDMKTYMSTSEAETQEIGENFTRKLTPGDIVLLYGDLGFGKTTFVKGIAKGLGIKTRIISPTFVILKGHNIKSKKLNIKNTNKILKMFHVDLYRIESQSQLEGIGIREIMDHKSSVKLIEWPEKLRILPDKRKEVRFILNKDNTRTIKILEHE